jgi:hypothetical protein
MFTSSIQTALLIINCFSGLLHCFAVRNDERKTHAVIARSAATKQPREKFKIQSSKLMDNEKLKFPAGISLGRNFTATKVTCGAAAVFQVICGNPHDVQNDLIVVTSLRGMK